MGTPLDDTIGEISATSAEDPQRLPNEIRAFNHQFLASQQALHYLLDLRLLEAVTGFENPIDFDNYDEGNKAECVRAERADQSGCRWGLNGVVTHKVPNEDVGI